MSTSVFLPSPFYGGGQVPNPCNVLFSTSAPVANAATKPGIMDVDTTNGNVYVSTGVGIWAELGGLSGPIDSLAADSGSAVPSAGVVTIAGTANQISTTGSGSTITLALTGPYTPATYTAHGVLIGEGSSSIQATAAGVTGQLFAGATGANPGWTASPSVTGSLTAGTTITATSGAITATNGNLVMGTAGNKVIVPTGSNASAGTSGMMSGTPGAVTVATTASSSTCLIFYCRNVTGGTPGHVSITAQDGTGFTLTSTGNETSTFNWWIINA